MVVPHCAPERREQCPPMANPSAPSLRLWAWFRSRVRYRRLVPPQRDRLGLEQAWVLGVDPRCETAPTWMDGDVTKTIP